MDTEEQADLSHPVVTLFPGQSKRSLGLPVEETPETPWEENPRQWASVNEFGARGDGFADDTAAIQRAMDSGRSVIYFQPGSYVDQRLHQRAGFGAPD